MESKEKLNDIRNHLFDELCWRLEKDNQFRIKFCLAGKTNADIRKYVDGAYGIDIISKDLDNINKLYTTIREKRYNTRLEKEIGQEKRDMSNEEKSELLGEICAYNDILSLMESMFEGIQEWKK